MAEDYYASDDSFIDDSEAFEAAEKRDATEQRTGRRSTTASSPCPGTWRPSKHPHLPRSRARRSLVNYLMAVRPRHMSMLSTDKDAELTCQQQNPKRGESALRYDKYKAATSAKQLLALGATRADIKNDLAKGYVTLKEPLAGLVITPAVRTSKRCGACEGCTADECGACKYCLDMSKRGGPNTLRRPCVKRACLRPLDGSQPPATSQPRRRRGRRRRGRRASRRIGRVMWMRRQVSPTGTTLLLKRRRGTTPLLPKNGRRLMPNNHQ